mmetsp:Transcript_9993/g.40517  ORF Transcript_9993/g.40517 Transcript_9993/m.40517 type:complete len:402 (+) Transcript_9993:2508-3713(+)
MERRGDGGEVGDERSAPAGQAQEAEHLLLGPRLGELLDGLNRRGVDRHGVALDDVAEVLHSIVSGPALARLEHDVATTTRREHPAQLADEGAPIVVAPRDVIDEDRTDIVGMLGVERLVHVSLEGARRVAQAEHHNARLEESLVRHERGLGAVLGGQRDLPVPREASEPELVTTVAQLAELLVMVGERVRVLERDLVVADIVEAVAHGAVRLGNEYWLRGPRTRRRLDHALSEHFGELATFGLELLRRVASRRSLDRPSVARLDVVIDEIGLRQRLRRPDEDVLVLGEERAQLLLLGVRQLGVDVDVVDVAEGRVVSRQRGRAVERLFVRREILGDEIALRGEEVVEARDVGRRALERRGRDVGVDDRRGDRWLRDSPRARSGQRGTARWRRHCAREGDGR